MKVLFSWRDLYGPGGWGVACIRRRGHLAGPPPPQRRPLGLLLRVVDGVCVGCDIICCHGGLREVGRLALLSCRLPLQRFLDWSL